MGSAKEDLRTTIEALSEAEAARAMEYIRRLRGRVSREHALGVLARNPDVRIPPAEAGAFALVEPIRGEGVPASRLLIEDRR
jgi:hypothetical protein